MRRALASHLTAFAVLPALIGGLIIALGGAWVVQAEVFARLQSIADGAGSELQLVSTDLVGDLDRFAQRQKLRHAAAVLADPTAAPAARETQQAAMAVQLGQLLAPTEHLGGAVVVVSLRTGQPLAWAGATASHAREIVAHHVPSSRLKEPRAWLSPAHKDVVTGLPTIAVIQALALPEGRSGPPVAAVICHVPLRYRIYYAIEERCPIGRTGEVLLVDRSGLALRDLRYEPGSAFRKTIQAVPAQAAAAGERGIKLARDYRGVLVVAAVTRVPTTRWGIVAKEDAVEVYAPVARLALVWVVLVGVLSLAAVVRARRISARFLEPIEQLALATHRVARGELDTTVPAHRDDELGALVSDFNLMAVQIALAHEALQQSEERLRLALEAADEALWDWDLTTDAVFRSPRFYEMLGYDSGEIGSGHEAWEALLHPDDAARASAAIAANLQSGGRMQCEYRMRACDGGYVWVLSRGEVVTRDAAGAPLRMVGTLQDITRQHGAEEALVAVNARLEAIISASPMAIYMMDRERGVQLWNPAAEKLFGWSEEEVLGLDRPPIVQTAEEEFARAAEQLLAGRPLRGLETVQPHRDGTLLPVSISAAPLRGRDGTVSGWVTVIADISERVRADMEFEERTALDKLVQVTHHLLSETTPEGLLQRTIEGARELLDAEMCRVMQGYHGGAFRLDIASVAPGYEAGLPGGDFEVPMPVLERLIQNPQASRRTLDQVSEDALPPPELGLSGFLRATLIDEAQQPSGLILVARSAGGPFHPRDESLLQQLATFASLALARLEALRELELQARALSASNRELEAFSYSVSHDLRAPLRAIDGFSQALLEEYEASLDEQGRHYLDRVRGATQRMGDLIDDLLTLSRVSRDPMRWETVDLSAMAHEIIAELRVGEPERQVEATITEGLVAEGHPPLLRALLANLLGNAWKFTAHRAEAQIEFGATEQDGETVYFVRDNGAGFDMRYAEKLFTPFQRLHAQEEFPGNGVGLATVQRVVNRHGGRAWAEGVVDQGANFYFTLGE